MQVAPNITRHCPFLLESDVLSLSPDFRLTADGQTLEDTKIAALHALHSPAEHIAQALVHGIRFDSLRVCAARHYVRSIQLTEILGFINLLGGLTRRRSAAGWLQASYLQGKDLVMGVFYSKLSWRKPATSINIGLGIVRACTPVFVAIGLLGCLTISAGLVTFWHYVAVAGFSTGIFISSLWAHERAHILIMQKNKTTAVLLQRGMRLGIIHAQMPRKAEIQSAAIGPATGIAVALSAAILTYSYSHTLASLGVIIAIFHLCGFLPWYGDGISLRRAINKNIRQTNETTT